MKKIIKTISNVIASSLLLGSATEIMVSSQALGSNTSEVKIKNESKQTFDADKYETTHPLTPFTENPGKLTKGNVLGQGGMSVVYDGTMDKQDVIIKEAIGSEGEPELQEINKQALRWESKAGEKMLEAQKKTLMALEKISQNEDRDKRKDPLLSSIQGFEGAVVPVLSEKDGEVVIVQERINGLDGINAILYGDGQNSPYANGCVDDPQKAIERICGLVLALHSLHTAGIVHRDLKLENIMFEKYGIPTGVIQEEMLAQARALRNKAKVLEETRAEVLEEMKAKALEKIRAKTLEIRAKALETRADELETRADELVGEAQCEYRIRLIDFGIFNTKERGSYNGAPEFFLPDPLHTIIFPNWQQDVLKPSYDIYTLGTMLPPLLFGTPDNENTPIIDFFRGDVINFLPSQFLTYCMGKKVEEYFEKYEKYLELDQQQEQLWQDVVDYEDQYQEKLRALTEEEKCTEAAYSGAHQAERQEEAKEINLDSRSKVLSLRERINIYNGYIDESKRSSRDQEQWEKMKQLRQNYKQLKQQLKQDMDKYYGQCEKKWYELDRELKECQSCLTEFEQACGNEILKTFKPKEEVEQVILNIFITLNEAMGKVTGRFYPEPVLTRLAKITADCLSIDPKLRPTAEEVLMELTDLALSDWGLEEDSFDQEKDLEVEALKALKTLKGHFEILKPLKYLTRELKALKTLGLKPEALEALGLKPGALETLKALKTLTDLTLGDLEALKALDLEAEDLEVLKTLEALKTPTYKIENLYNRTQD